MPDGSVQTFFSRDNTIIHNEEYFMNSQLRKTR